MSFTQKNTATAPVSPQISVVLITFNLDRFIGDTIQSILNQSCTDFELIIIDDGSTDRTQEVIQTFSDPRIRSVQQENQGPGSAMNHGIRLSRGEYIALGSGDDLNHPLRLETQLQAAQSQNRKVVFSHVSYIDEKGVECPCPPWLSGCFNVSGLTRSQLLKKLILESNLLNAPSAFLHKSVFTELSRAHPFNPLFLQLQDHELWIELLKKHDILVLSTPLIQYRIRSGANLSAPSNKTFQRGSIEYFLFSEHIFEGISDPLFKETFHDRLVHKDFKTPFERKIEESLLLLSTNQASLRLRGVESLAKILQNPEEYKILQEQYKLTPIQFSKILQYAEIFSPNRPPLMSRLYYDPGNGFSETNSIGQSTPLEYDTFSLSFDLAKIAPIYSLRWDPTEDYPSEIQLTEAHITRKDGTQFIYDLATIRTNGEQVGHQQWHFETLDPMMIFQVDESLVESIEKFELSGKWNFFEKPKVSHHTLKAQTGPSTTRRGTLTEKIARAARRLLSKVH